MYYMKNNKNLKAYAEDSPVLTNINNKKIKNIIN